MIVIAGAGIGGFTLGCALNRAQRPFLIFERAAELRPVGAGIVRSTSPLTSAPSPGQVARG